MAQNERDRPSSHFDEIPTQLTDIREAHGDDPEAARQAKERIVLRYERAIRSYLHAALRDGDAVDEVFQEFSVRLARGSFGSYNPAIGRFRHFLKRSLSRLIIDQRNKRRPVVGTAQVREPAAPPDEPHDDQMFLTVWCEDLLRHAWEGLERREQETGKPLYLFLKHKVDNPGVRSKDMAELFGPRLGRDLTAVAVRKSLSEARDCFEDLLLERVSESLGRPSVEELECELIELNLLRWCRDAFHRRRAGMPSRLRNRSRSSGSRPVPPPADQRPSAGAP